MTPASQPPLHVTVVGAGYVGLVTAVGLTVLGARVTVVDHDPGVVAGLRAGNCPIHEPGLPLMLRHAIGRNQLRISESLPDAVADADVAVVAVATPSLPDGGADLRAVDSVVDTIADAARDGLVVVVKSTVPVGTCDALAARIEARRGTPLPVASNPEFLRESSAMQDFLRPDRVVVGVPDKRTGTMLRRLYAPLIEAGRPFLELDTCSAELTKYAANAMLATRISFMNQLTELCERTGGDIELVREGIGADPRVGPSFLRAGIGFGGSCFPKDLRALSHTARQHGLRVPIVDAVIEVNEAQQHLPVRWLEQRIDLHGTRLGVWGLTFKPDTDDLRDSPALVVIEDLLAAGAIVTVHDPCGGDRLPGHLRDRVTVAEHPLGAATSAEALLHLTEWDEYRRVPLAELAACMSGTLVIDARNTLDVASLRAHGLTVLQVGRGARMHTAGRPSAAALTVGTASS